MNWLTILLVAVIAFVTWRAYANGFIRELVSLSAAILAIPMAGIFYPHLYKKLSPIITNHTAAYLISFLAILAGVIIAGQVAAHLLKRTVAMLNLGAVDKLAGGAFGFIKIVIICQVILVALVRFPSPDLQSSIDSSAAASKLLDTAPAVLAFLPKTFDTAISAFNSGLATANGVEGGLAGPTPGATPTPVQ
ncbi:MAG: CvpA family protein [Tepidiformaceae bacterium]